jgi:hypothetical protein
MDELGASRRRQSLEASPEPGLHLLEVHDTDVSTRDRRFLPRVFAVRFPIEGRQKVGNEPNGGPGPLPRSSAQLC